MTNTQRAMKADYASQINPSIVNQGSSGTGNNDKASGDAGSLSVEHMVQNMANKDYSASIDLAAAGDILCQQSVPEKAYDSENVSFDFSNDFQYVKDLFPEIRLCCCHIEDDSGWTVQWPFR